MRMSLTSGQMMRAGLVLGLASAAAAFMALPAEAQSLTIDLNKSEGGSLSGRVIQTIVLLSVLSIAPGLLVMMTSFTRIVVVLSCVRSAIGLQQSPPNMVMVSLALFLTAFIMQPSFDKAWQDGLRPLIDDEISEEVAFERMLDPFRAFMEANVRDKDLALFESLAAYRGKDAGKDAGKTQVTASQAAPEGAGPAIGKRGDVRPDIRILVPAFMISELKRAFEIGFLLFLPFLVIDIVVSGVLQSMGMMMLPPTMIALPFKIVFFVLVDGWNLLAGALVRSYAGI